MKTNFLIICFLLIFSLSHTTSQNLSDSTSSKLQASKFHFSFFSGFSIFGPKKDIESNMLASGYGDQSSANLFGNGEDHPNTDRFPIFDFEASLFLNRNRGISLNTGLANNIEVQGYDDKGIGNYLFLKSEIWSISLNYLFQSKNNKHNFSFGPSYIIHSVESKSSNPFSDKNKKLGIYAGYSYSLVQKKHFILNFKTNFRWATHSEIGPYITEYQMGLINPVPETITSIFKETKVSLAIINIGIAIGFKIGKQ